MLIVSFDQKLKAYTLMSSDASVKLVAEVNVNDTVNAVTQAYQVNKF